MRKRQMNFIKEMIDILERAHESTYKALSVNSYSSDSLDAITNLLTGCQTTAINIGNLIEESEGEGFITVKYLEDYCELVYSINEELREIEGSINSEKISKKLNKMLLKIENSIKHDIPLRREAVFLPYKASMWDSLESVWEAAEADPDCDAYVIPIPYFDKNPDGSVREEHYEADLFPENVLITHYSEYDFGKHHPDMIFIHNPYDYGNLVTTIHPFFYAENMKKVTDCLVYVPYFATSGAMSESRAWCPVYDYVDYIVIQHESFRKYYSVDIPEEKFLPLGSPKFDKVIKKCQNPPKPKEEWQKRMDGRKVFFYNTSLNGMLQDTPQFLRKMQYVFETFKNHPECCLLWRPHPLFESTLHAMRPECIEVFNALKQDFLKQENWIYDDTPSVEDTIAICDGYIGDEASSIVSLFEVSGKPIFKLNNNILHEPSAEELKYICNNAAGIEDRDPITKKYILITGNKIFEYSNKEKKYKFYCDLSDFSERPQYMCVIEKEDYLMAFPLIGQQILIIKGKDKIDKINLLREGINLAFHDYYVKDEYVFLIPFNYSSIVRVDTEKMQIDYISGARDLAYINEQDRRWQSASWMMENYLCLISNDGNKIIMINCSSLNISEVNINTTGQYIAAHYEEKKKRVWLFPRKGTKIAIWDSKGNSIKYVDVDYPNLESYSRDKKRGKEELFCSIIEDGEEYILAPYLANMFLKIDKNDELVGKIDYNIPLNEGLSNFMYRGIEHPGKVRRVGGKQIYYSYLTGERYLFEEGNFIHEDVFIDIEDLSSNWDRFKVFNSYLGYVCLEDEFNTLEKYIKGTFFDAYDKTKQLLRVKEINSNVDGNSGEKIYASLIGKI